MHAFLGVESRTLKLNSPNDATSPRPARVCPWYRSTGGLAGRLGWGAYLHPGHAQHARDHACGACRQRCVPQGGPQGGGGCERGDGKHAVVELHRGRVLKRVLEERLKLPRPPAAARLPPVSAPLRCRQSLRHLRRGVGLLPGWAHRIESHCRAASKRRAPGCGGKQAALLRPGAPYAARRGRAGQRSSGDARGRRGGT
jgi:hypothetical protein